MASFRASFMATVMGERPNTALIFACQRAPISACRGGLTARNVLLGAGGTRKRVALRLLPLACCGWLGEVTPKRPPHGSASSGNGASGRGGANLLQVEFAVAEQRFAQREPLVVVADGQLVGHAHAAVQLDGLAADQPGRARRLHLRCPYGTLRARRLVVERLQRRVNDGSR